MPNLRALIVEDDADINQIVATHLADRDGALRRRTPGAKLACCLPARAQTGPVPFDVVICDLMLPRRHR